MQEPGDNYHASQPASRRAGGPVLIVTLEHDGARASLVCRDPAERRRLEPLIELVRTVVDAAIERGFAGAA